jgi:hypothetical protein
MRADSVRSLSYGLGCLVRDQEAFESRSQKASFCGAPLNQVVRGRFLPPSLLNDRRFARCRERRHGDADVRRGGRGVSIGPENGRRTRRQRESDGHDETPQHVTIIASSGFPFNCSDGAAPESNQPSVGLPRRTSFEGLQSQSGLATEAAF